MPQTLRTVLAVVFCIVAMATGRAQSFELERSRHTMAQLDGLWRFHTGDEAGWAAPAFDDRSWPLLRADEDWSSQGYKGVSGLAWYRFLAVIPAGAPPQSLELPGLYTSYEVFVEGARVGGFGEMPPHGVARSPLPRVFALSSPRPAVQTVHVAIRVWHDPAWAMYHGGGPTAAAVVGDAALIDARAQQGVAARAWGSSAEIFLALMEALAAGAALILFSLRVSQREYLWFGLMLGSSAGQRCLFLWAHNHFMAVGTRAQLVDVLGALYFLASLAFYLRLLRGRRNWLLGLTVSCVLGGALAPFLGGWGLLSVAVENLLSGVFALPFSVWVILLLLQAAGRRVADARLLLAPVLLQQVVLLYGDFGSVPLTAGWETRLPDLFQPLAHWPLTYNINNLVDAVFLLTMMAILILRFTRTLREADRYGAELEAATSVQHVLIPDEIAPVPGLTIDSAYHPAGEVGGDFFQVIPLGEGGGALIAIGDVSGKGVSAAMNVALIIGSLRTLAEQTQSPAAVLAGLNRRLYGRSSGGFTTCLVLHAAASGVVTVANAGHLPPYRNGEELTLEHDLPLGLVAEANYIETRITLAAGERLTLLSDGVVEARGPGGELFGFERTQAVSLAPAAEIAGAAERFRHGRAQEDDITVLTVTRTPA